MSLVLLNQYLRGMIALQFPESKPSIRRQAGKEQVFCVARNRWVALTPEEWVRQNLLLMMHENFGYPLSLASVEKQVRVGELTRRFDILWYDRQGRPFLVMECKEPDVALTEDVLQQVLRYNIPLRAPFVFISNGKACMGFELIQDQFREIGEFPPMPLH
ncbi:MAG TPA: restriction endonuclease subunit R [Chitinophagaceae bacterium]|nr:restriction endonuclease subunit R [Chitinophagaceae bacterium]